MAVRFGSVRPLGGKFLLAVAAFALPRELDFIAGNFALVKQLHLVPVELHHLRENELASVHRYPHGKSGKVAQNGAQVSSR